MTRMHNTASRERFTGYEHQPDDALEVFILEDLDLDPQKVRRYVAQEIVPRYGPVPAGKTPEWWFYQIEVHANTFHEHMNGYGDHEQFPPYAPVVEWAKKVQQDLRADVVIATARGDHLIGIEQKTEECIHHLFGPHFKHVRAGAGQHSWVRVPSSGKKPEHLAGVDMWVDDDYRHPELRGFLKSTGVYVVKRWMQFNDHLPFDELITDPRSPHQPALEAAFDYCDTMGVRRVGLDLDDTLRPYREHIGEATRLFAEMKPGLVDRLRKTA